MGSLGPTQHFDYSFSFKGKTFSSESNGHAFPSAIKQLRAKMSWGKKPVAFHNHSLMNILPSL